MRTGIALITYLISYTTYLWSMENIALQESTRRLWNYYSIGGLLLFIFVREIQSLTRLEKELLDTAKVVIVITIFIIILHYHLIIINVYYMMAVIDITALMLTIIVIVSGHKHGFLKNES